MDQTRLEEQTFAVTNNLCSVLGHLRFPDKSGTLLADAIYINQLDITEGSQKVKEMREIYEGTPRALVWLDDKENADVAISSLKEG
jgi:hypothetical protein